MKTYCECENVSCHKIFNGLNGGPACSNVASVEVLLHGRLLHFCQECKEYAEADPELEEDGKE